MKAARVLAAFAAFAAWAWCAGSHAAPLGDNTVRLSPSQLRLPQAIGPLRYSGQNRFNDRRLGRSYGYNTAGISLSLYVYDYGVRGVPDGADSVPLCEQFETAKREIEQGGNYENVTLMSESSRLLADGGNAHVAREALYRFERRGIRAVSALWLTAVDGFFIKLRLSLRWEVADELDEARTHILAALQEAIESRKRKPRETPPPVEEASIELGADVDTDTAAPWFEYAAHLVTTSRSRAEIRPACGGPLIPDFAAELDARRAALAAYRARVAAHRSSRYFDELSRVEEAGFLPEYVWHFLRDEQRDLQPPGELRMGDFAAYLQRELPDHVVQSGARVRINTVRILPAAPTGN
jgi:hypothetical protein